MRTLAATPSPNPNPNPILNPPGGRNLARVRTLATQYGVEEAVRTEASEILKDDTVVAAQSAECAANGPWGAHGARPGHPLGLGAAIKPLLSPC